MLYNSIRSSIKKIRRLIEHEHYEEAKRLCKKMLSLKLEPAYVEAIHALEKLCDARICVKMGKSEDALKYYDKAIRHLENSCLPVMNKQKILYEKYIRKNELLRRKIDEESDERQRMTYREEMLRNAQETGRYMNPNSWKFYEIKGDESKISCIINKAKGEYEQALKDIENAIKYYKEARKRKESKRFDKTMKYCEALRAETSAQQKYMTGDIKAAIDYYKQGAQLYSECYDAESERWCTFLYTFLEGLFMILSLHRENWIRGIKLLSKALTIMPKEYKEEIESHKIKILSGTKLPEDKKNNEPAGSAGISF